MTSVKQRLCSVCANVHHSVCPPKPALFCLIKNSSCLLPLSWRGKKLYNDLSLSTTTLWRTNAQNLNLSVTVCHWQAPNANIATPKPPLSFHFTSGVLQATVSNSVDGFRCTHLCHAAPLPISGVLIENSICIMRWVLSRVNYRLSTGEEEELGMLHMERRNWPMLCSLNLNRRLSRLDKGRNWKVTFLSLPTHWPECKPRPLLKESGWQLKWLPWQIGLKLSKWHISSLIV